MSAAEIERRAERLFYLWESKDRPGTWESGGMTKILVMLIAFLLATPAGEWRRER